MYGKLISRNITVLGNRTSIRLEETTWDALDQICDIEGMVMHDICSRIERVRHTASRTAAVRAFIVMYFRTVANDTGTLRGGVVNTILAQESGSTDTE